MTGREFYAWRRLRAMTQVDAARAIGVSRRTVQIWEAAPDAPIPKPVANLVRLMAPADA